MKARLDFRQASPEGMKAMSGLHTFVHDCGLDRTLLELVKLRASQINGCGHCIDMHVKELRAMGEGEQRLHLLDAREESPFYSDRERAALTWCEAVLASPKAVCLMKFMSWRGRSSAKRSSSTSPWLSWRSTARTASTSPFVPCREATGCGAQSRRQSRGPGVDKFAGGLGEVGGGGLRPARRRNFLCLVNKSRAPRG